MAARVSIDGRQYDFFNKVSLDLKYGYAASTFSFSALFDPDNATHRRIFRPLSYQDVVITSELGETLLTGTILRHKFPRSSKRELSTFSGYSKSGVLGDCTIPKSVYPLEFTNLSFEELATRLIEPFGIDLFIQDFGVVAEQIIDSITAQNTESVYGFLNNIISQRNLVLTNSPLGNLVLTRPNANSEPVASFRQSIPVTKINLDVNGQALHSQLTALKQADIANNNASDETISNPLVTSFRPTLKEQNVGNDVTVEDAARNIRASELRNIKLTIETDRWTWLRNRTPETMTPNNVVSVIAPDNYIFNRTNFFVESVKLNLDENKETAILTCVLPEVYNNNEPQNIF